MINAATVSIPAGRSAFGIEMAEKAARALDDIRDNESLQSELNGTLSTFTGVYQTSTDEKNIAMLGMKLNAGIFSAVDDRSGPETLEFLKAAAGVTLDALKGSICGPIGVVTAEISAKATQIVYDKTGDAGKALSVLGSGFCEIRENGRTEQAARTVAQMMDIAEKGKSADKDKLVQAGMAGMDFIRKGPCGSTGSNLAGVAVQISGASGDAKASRALMQICLQSISKNEHLPENERLIAGMGVSLGEELSVDDRLTSGVDRHLRNRIILDDGQAVKAGAAVLEALATSMTTPVTAAMALISRRAAEGADVESAGFIFNKAFGSISSCEMASPEDKKLAAEGRRINWTEDRDLGAGSPISRQSAIMDKIQFGALRDILPQSSHAREDFIDFDAGKAITVEEEYVDIQGIKLSVNRYLS